MAQYRARDEVEFFDFESLTVGSTSVDLAQKNNGADYALITVETDQIRWNAADRIAVATNHLASVADVIELEGSQNIKGFRAIRVTADATLRISYGRYVRPT